MFVPTSRFLACTILLAALGLWGNLIAAPAAQRAPDNEPGGPSSPLLNAIVNAPDTTEHDTQSTAAILTIPGTSIVVAAFTNSAVYTGSNNHLTGWSRSTDNGTTWNDLGALPNSAFGDGGGPVLARDDVTGQLYLSTKAFAGSSAVPLFRSNSNGASWALPVNAAPGFGGGDFLDTPRVAVDNFPGTGQGNVYVVARNIAGGGGGSQTQGVYFSRSTDGGATFGAGPGLLLSGTGGMGPNVLVGPDHAVYVFFYSTATPRAIRVVKSTNLGVSFGSIMTVVTLTGTGIGGDLGLGGGFQTNSFPQVAVDPIDGELNVLYNDKDGTDKGNIYVTSSSDGTSWDTPFQLNNDSPYLGDHDQFMPTAAFTPDGRHVMVAWYDRRSDPGNSLIERWGVIGTRGSFGCCSITPNFRISTGSWPVVIGQDSYVPPTYMGAYDQLAASDVAFFAAWGDNRSPNPANAPLPHPNQPDVRFARIPVSGPPLGDLDRDLATDRTVFRPSTGVWYSALTGGGAIGTPWGAPGDIDVQGDYDGDGKADVAVFRPSNGTWYIIQSSNGAVRAVPWGASGDIPLSGDMDIDGKDDLVIYRNGDWYFYLSGGGTGYLGWGSSTDQPFLADFDGDGAADPTVFRPSNGFWFSYLQASGGVMFIGWGTTGDIPVVGDFDGDGTSDVTVFRPSTGQWFVLNSSGGSTVLSWGISGDYPLSGDQDGDGRSDFIVWRPSTGSWYTQFAAGGVAFVPWGMNGDKPSGRLPGS